MFKMILEEMERRSAEGLKGGTNARALWFNEWAKFFLKAYEADKKVVYTSYYALPMEILAAFDVAAFDFELAGSMISSTDIGVPMMVEAEDRGFSMDICSMHREAIGAYYKDYFPKPDLLLSTSFYCDGKWKTNEILSRMFGKRSILLYVPSEINKDSIDYVAKQLREMAFAISDVVGEKFDQDRLKEAVKKSNRARKAQLKFLDLLKHKPAPWGGSQIVQYAIFGTMFNGTDTMEILHEAFSKIFEERIKTGALRPEKHRIYWFAWIPTYQSNLFDILKENQVGVPVCENLMVYWDEIDENNPFEGLALKCLKNPYVGPISRRIEGFDKIVDEYSIDGAILFATPACRHSKSAYKYMKDSIARLGIPFLMIDMDICDPRSFSAEQTKTRVEGFIEVLNG